MRYIVLKVRLVVLEERQHRFGHVRALARHPGQGTHVLIVFEDKQIELQFKLFSKTPSERCRNQPLTQTHLAFITLSGWIVVNVLHHICPCLMLYVGLRMQEHMRKLDEWHRVVEEAGVNMEELDRFQMGEEEARHLESVRLHEKEEKGPHSGSPHFAILSAEELVALVLDGPASSRHTEVGMLLKYRFISGKHRQALSETCYDRTVA